MVLLSRFKNKIVGVSAVITAAVLLLNGCVFGGGTDTPSNSKVPDADTGGTTATAPGFSGSDTGLTATPNSADSAVPTGEDETATAETPDASTADVPATPGEHNTQSPTSAPVTDAPVSATPETDYEVPFTDPFFAKAVREYLGKSSGPVYYSEVYNIKSLSLKARGIMNIVGIECFKSLEELDISGNKIKDLSPVFALTNLKSLKVSNNSLSDSADETRACLSGLSSLAALEVLDISNNGIVYVSPLAGLRNLKTLNVSSNKLRTLAGLEGIVSLEVLYADSNQISDASALSSCVNMKTLSLKVNGYYEQDADGAYTGKYIALSDLSFTSKMSALEFLDVSSNRITTLKGLEKHTALRELIADFNHITDASALVSCRSLKTLSLAGNSYYETDEFGQPAENRVGLSDISFAASLSYLETLNIFSCKVESLEALNGNTALKELVAFANLIEDIEPLRHSNIEVLDLSYNEITVFEAIAEMPGLKTFIYEGNPIDDETETFIDNVLNGKVSGDLQPGNGSNDELTEAV